MKLLEEKAVDAIQSAQSLAEVLQLWDYWLTAINNQLGTSTHEHTYSENWSCDPYYHWHNATCVHTGLTSDFGEHTFDEGKTEGNLTVYTCTECRYKKYVSYSKNMIIITKQ